VQSVFDHHEPSRNRRTLPRRQPLTNIRNTSSPHWRGWLKPESRCLVPANSFAEYAPQPNPETKNKDVVWFALNEGSRRSPRRWRDPTSRDWQRTAPSARLPAGTWGAPQLQAALALAPQCEHPIRNAEPRLLKSMKRRLADTVSAPKSDSDNKSFCRAPIGYRHISARPRSRGAPRAFSSTRWRDWYRSIATGYQGALGEGENEKQEAFRRG
jgi:hypothetical protein